MKFRTWFRSAITGKFVKQKEAQASPDTTVSHKVPLDAYLVNPPKPWNGKIWYPLGK